MTITDLIIENGDFKMTIPSLHFEHHRIHGLLGGNGCGKSTLAKALIGAITPLSGTIDTEGFSPRDITLTSQRPYLLHDTVYANLIYPLKLRGIHPDEKAMDLLLERSGLSAKKKQYARSLSSGEQQKLSFLRALVFNPKCIIIDETLSNMDPESLSFFEALILEKQATEPITWIIISHQLPQVSRLCDTVHFMDKGHIIESGDAQRVIYHSKEPRTREFMEKQMLTRGE